MNQADIRKAPIQQWSETLNVGYGKTKKIRTYKYGEQKGLSVSTVPELLVPFSLQDYYKARKKDEIQENLQTAATLGTEAHSLIEQKAKGEQVVPKEELKEWFTQWEKQEAEYQCVAEATEVKVFSQRFCYGGQIDRIGMWKGKRYIIDFKTGSYSHVDLWKTEAYRQCYIEMTGDSNIGTLVWYLPKPKLMARGFKPRQYSVSRHDSCFVTWLGLYDAFKMLYHTELIKLGMRREDVYSKGTQVFWDRKFHEKDSTNQAGVS